ncbi:hypothetical protein HDU82_006580 [Entophlyctis luteolus]|nr:hypothetical protein HDU82_006580 [Entophlyctis luteolus]
MAFLPDDVYAEILLPLRLQDIAALAATSKALRSKTNALQNSLWFASRHVAFFVLQIKAYLQVKDDAELLADRENEEYFVTTTQHWFCEELVKLQFWKLPPAYNASILLMFGATYQSLKYLGLLPKVESLRKNFRFTIWRRPQAASKKDPILQAIRTVTASGASRSFWEKTDTNIFLVWACCHNYPEIIQLVIDERVNFSKQSFNKCFVIAAGCGFLELTRHFVEEWHVHPGVFENAAIQWAAKSGHSDIVSYLLSDVRVNPGDSQGASFIWAVEQGHKDIVKRLLVHPLCDPSAQNNSALVEAGRHGHNDILKLMLAHPRVSGINTSMESILACACLYGQSSTVNLLLHDYGWSEQINERSLLLNMKTALDIGHTAVVRTIVKNSQSITSALWMRVCVLFFVIFHPRFAFRQVMDMVFN